MKKIPASDLVAFSPFEPLFPISVDPVYARADHPENHFGQIYHPDARIWGHRDLVRIVLLAARRLNEEHGWRLVIKDCLRPVEAQTLMIETPVVKANPHWLEEPRFLSGPGQGGHPRGMAVDLGAMDGSGAAVDFGTRFDHFSASSDKDTNPAHREYQHLPASVKDNRLALEAAMVEAARDTGLPMLPLPQEWWDFRFPFSYSKDFAPLAEGDLLPHQKMTTPRETALLVADERLLEELGALA